VFSCAEIYGIFHVALGILIAIFLGADRASWFSSRSRAAQARMVAFLVIAALSRFISVRSGWLLERLERFCTTGLPP
jgi:prolipoprotein diacylglyceryltransferase